MGLEQGCQLNMRFQERGYQTNEVHIIFPDAQSRNEFQFYGACLLYQNYMSCLGASWVYKVMIHWCGYWFYFKSLGQWILLFSA